MAVSCEHNDAQHASPVVWLITVHRVVFECCAIASSRDHKAIKVSSSSGTASLDSVLMQYTAKQILAYNVFCLMLQPHSHTGMHVRRQTADRRRTNVRRLGHLRFRSGVV